jgi:hypothetical protein
MKRPLVLLATVLALVLAACGSDQPDASATPASTPAATPTQAATPEPTPSQAAETPDQTEGDGGTGSVITGSLSDALPAEVGGLAKQEVEGMDAFIGPMLQQQGVDAEEADFAFASYGEGEAAESLIVTAIRMPGVDQTELEMMARLISRSQAPGASGVEAESVTIGGKDVLRVSPPDEEQSVYVYLASDAFFSVISQSDELAEDLLSQLP